MICTLRRAVVDALAQRGGTGCEFFNTKIFHIFFNDDDNDNFFLNGDDNDGDNYS